MSKYSIILPVRNGGTHVKECVQSILSQQYTDFNLLVLDNNSSDGSLQWLQSLEDKRVVVYPSDVSLSIEANWGRIKSIPKNEFITLIGHDDILHAHYLQEMDSLILLHPAASLYQAHYDFIDTGGAFTGHCLPMDELQYGHEFLACQLSFTMNSMGTGYMMRSKDYDRLGGMPTHYPNLIFADYQLWVALSLINYKATTHKTCFSYRIHQNVSKLTNGEQYQEAFGKYVFFLADLQKDHPKVRSVIERYGHDFLMYFCESLSHRLLKTSTKARTTKVDDFIDRCKTYANLLIPGQAFEPAQKFKINIAKKLDSIALGRSAFYLFKKFTR